MKVSVLLMLLSVVCLTVPVVGMSEEAPTEVILEDETNQLFQQDPNPGGEEGGCSLCVYRIDTHSLSCDPVTNGQGFTKCKLTVTETEATCESSGSSCIVTQVNP